MRKQRPHPSRCRRHPGADCPRPALVSMVRMAVLLRRAHVDDRMHPRVDAAFEKVYTLAESGYLNAVPGGNDGRERLGAFRTRWLTRPVHRPRPRSIPTPRI